MGDITSANAVYAISIPLLFPIPQQLQGFDVDDIFDTVPAKVAETKMGVDGIMSGGRIPYITEQGIILQADSISIAMFETWNQVQKSTKSIIPANALVTLTAIRRKYTCVFGILETYPAISDAKKVLQARKFTIHWQSVDPAPF